MTKRSNSNTSGRIGLWQMIRDVLVTSMSKGQFPMAMVGLIILFTLYRLPQPDLSKLVFEVFETFKTGQIMGWVLAVGQSVAWFLHSKHQRRMMHDEVARIAKERDDYQTQVLGRLITSSNR